MRKETRTLGLDFIDRSSSNNFIIKGIISNEILHLQIRDIDRDSGPKKIPLTNIGVELIFTGLDSIIPF
jgi:hypothetical protein